MMEKPYRVMLTAPPDYEGVFGKQLLRPDSPIKASARIPERYVVRDMNSPLFK